MNATQRPNILLVMTDQQRWDALAGAGELPVQTPALDRLASEGIWFRRVYAQSPLCVPSRTSFLTGRYPHQHQCVNNETSTWPEAPSFVRALRDGGYRTANVGKLHFTWFHDVELLVADPLLRAIGFDEPLETTGKMSRGNLRASAYSEYLKSRDLLEEFHADLLDRAEAGPLDVRPSILADDDHVDGWVMNRAVEWVESTDVEKPFFYWIGPEGPHDPYDPPEPYASMYDPAGIPLGPLEYQYPIGPSIASKDLPDATPEQIQRMRAHYLGNVTYIDEWLDRLLNALERRGLLATTWIVFCSDHGDLLGDHRLVGKAQFFESAIRVPLIIRPPDSVDCQRGVVHDGLVELIDVSATMLDIAGTSVEGHQGHSLLPLVTGGNDGQHRDSVFAEIYDQLMVVDGDRKLVLGPDDVPVHVFDLASDPAETDDLADTPPTWVDDLAALAKQFRASTPVDMPEPWRHVTPYEHWGRNPLRELGRRSGRNSAQTAPSTSQDVQPDQATERID